MSDQAPPAAVDMATKFEDFSATPYLDPAGVPTIGYGSIWDYRVGPTARVTMDTPPVTEADARTFVAIELGNAVHTVAHLVHVYLTNNMRAALDDFVFNLGSGNFAASTLLRLLNAGDYAGAADEFDKWDHAGGRELAGLLRRREAERRLFATPDAAT